MSRNRNQDIRDAIRRSDLLTYDIAKSLKVSESTFYRWLRTDLSERRKNEILKVINELEPMELVN